MPAPELIPHNNSISKGNSLQNGAQLALTLFLMSIMRDLVRRMNTKDQGIGRVEAVPTPAKHDERIPKRSAILDLLTCRVPTGNQAAACLKCGRWLYRIYS